jgi:hypothetical protein
MPSSCILTIRAPSSQSSGDLPPVITSLPELKMDAEEARQKAWERKAEVLANLPTDVSIRTIH